MASKKTIIVMCIIILMAMIFALNHSNAFALPKHTGYGLLYDRLYDYDSNTSPVLRQYIALKSDGQDVLLLQADKLDTAKIDKNAIIIIFPTSFESTEKYHKALNAIKGFQVITHNGQIVTADERTRKPGLLVAVDEVYPFSDFNKLMDIAESLHDKGIEFIASVMPVYDNYELDAFKKYMDVLKYVQEKGGRLFIHIPVENNKGRYNLVPGVLFERAVKEFRKHGLDIMGITLPQNRMLNDLAVYQGVGLPFILATESDGRINPESDLFQVSQALNDDIIINGTNINHFNYFGYREKTDFGGEQAAYIAIDDQADKLFDLLTVFRTERIPVRDFRAGDYRQLPRNSGYPQNVQIQGLPEKSQREKFMEEEMKKIKGENLKRDAFVMGYDISNYSKIAVRIALILLGVFSIMIFIGRRFDYRKFIKNQLFRE